MTAEPVSTPSTLTSDAVTSPALAGRMPPQDIEAERSLLGSMLLNREAIGDVLPIIGQRPERFYRPDHRRLFQVLIEMYDRGDPIDLVTVRNELARRAILKDVGDVDYLVQLAESVPSHLHAEHYAHLVCDKAMLRDLIAAAGEVIETAHDHREDAKEILDRAEQLLFHVTDQRVSEQAELIRALLDETFHQLEERQGHYITGLRTGFIELDDMLSGLQRGEMIIIAARPSMGKTAFGLNVAEHIASHERRPVVFFSMEMSKQAVAQRLLCARARVDSHKLRRGAWSDRDWEDLTNASSGLQDAPLLIDDTPGMSVLELRAKTRRLRKRQAIEAVFVDYLQLMRAPGRSDSRQQEVSEISRGLKALARELNIPVVVMAQLNRNPEQRTGNRPRMSDLRESGAIEQDADVIMLLHREEYYQKENPNPEIQGIAEVIVDKQRNGPTGIVKLFFNQKLTRFDNLAAGQEAAYAASGGYDSYDEYQAEAPQPGFNPPAGRSTPSADEESAPF